MEPVVLAPVDGHVAPRDVVTAKAGSPGPNVVTCAGSAICPTQDDAPTDPPHNQELGGSAACSALVDVLPMGFAAALPAFPDDRPTLRAFSPEGLEPVREKLTGARPLDRGRPA